MNPKRLLLLLFAGGTAATVGTAFSLRIADQRLALSTASVSGVARAQTPTTQRPDPAKLKANEIGRIPVVMYHSIDEPGTKYDAHGLNIHGQTFRKHLEMMAKAGWYPMS